MEDSRLMVFLLAAQSVVQLEVRLAAQSEVQLAAQSAVQLEVQSAAQSVVQSEVQSEARLVRLLVVQLAQELLLAPETVEVQLLVPAHKSELVSASA